MSTYPTGLIPATIGKSTTDLADHVAMDVAEIERCWLLYIEDQRLRTAAPLAQAAGISRPKAKALVEAFRERYVAETEKYRELSRPYLEGRMAGLVDAIADRIEDIVATGDNKEAISAMRLAVDIMGAGQGNGPQVTVHSQTLAIAAGGIASIDDIRRLVTASVNENVEAVDTLRASKANRERKR